MLFKPRPVPFYISLFLSLAATLFFSHSVSAQSPMTSQKPFTVNLGAYFASSGVENNARDTHFLLGLAYELGGQPHEVPLHYGLYADGIFRTSRAFITERYFIGSSDQDTVYVPYHESSGSSGYGIGVFGRSYLRPSSVSVRPYLGLGVGFYAESIDIGVTDFIFSIGSGRFMNNGLGGKLMAGVETRSGVTLESSYSLFPDMGDLSLRGYGLTVGYRF